MATPIKYLGEEGLKALIARIKKQDEALKVANEATATALATEEAARKNADTDLQGQINDIIKTLESEVIGDTTEGGTSLKDRVKANEDAITTLNGDKTVDNSVDKKIDTAIKDLIGGAPDALDTLGEIAKYLNGESKDVTGSIISKIADNTSAIDTLRGGVDYTGFPEDLGNVKAIALAVEKLDGNGDGSVDKKIDTAINGLKGTVDDGYNTLEKIEGKIKDIVGTDSGEVSDLPEGLQSINTIAEHIKNYEKDHVGHVGFTKKEVQDMWDDTDAEESEQNQPE